MTFYFYPFIVDPLKFAIAFNRPDNTVGATAFKGALTLQRNIQLGVFNTRVVENAVTCDFSIVDYLMADPQPEIDKAIMCTFNAVYEEDYIDPYW